VRAAVPIDRGSGPSCSCVACQRPSVGLGRQQSARSRRCAAPSSGVPRATMSTPKHPRRTFLLLPRQVSASHATSTAAIGPGRCTRLPPLDRTVFGFDTDLVWSRFLLVNGVCIVLYSDSKNLLHPRTTDKRICKKLWSCCEVKKNFYCSSAGIPNLLPARKNEWLRGGTRVWLQSEILYLFIAKLVIPPMRYCNNLCAMLVITNSEIL
jgi:hypothetical protein